MVGRKCPDRSSESLKKGALLMTSPFIPEWKEPCALELPGHNLPAKLHPGKMRRTKLSGAWLENRGGTFLLHRFCMPLPGCGYSYFQSLVSSGFRVPEAQRRFCMWRDEYATHYPDELARALEGSKKVELYEVQTKNLGGFLIYIPNVKRYFWLESALVFFWPNRECQKALKEENNSESSWYIDGPFIYEPTDYILGCTGPPD